MSFILKSLLNRGKLKGKKRLINIYLKIYKKLRLLYVFFDKKIYKTYNFLLIDIGGGASYKRYWKILDFYSKWYSHNKLYLDYNFDLMSKKKLPFEDKSVTLFYSEHTFEHITNDAVQHLINEIFRCLRKGGGVRIITPDIDLAYNAYANQDTEFFYSYYKDFIPRYKELPLEYLFLQYFATIIKHRVDYEEFSQNFRKMEKNEFLDLYLKKSEKIYQMYPSLYIKFAGLHRNWFDYTKLERMLSLAGFKKIYKSSPKGSRFKIMRSEKFDIRPSISLYVEAIKHY